MTTRSQIVPRRTPGDSEQLCHAWSESFGPVILAHAQATKCSKSLVKRDSPTGRANGTASVITPWVGHRSRLKLAREPRLVSPDVEVSPSGVERSRVITGPGRIGAFRAYQPRSGKPELYQQFVWTN